MQMLAAMSVSFQFVKGKALYFELKITFAKHVYRYIYIGPTDTCLYCLHNIRTTNSKVDHLNEELIYKLIELFINKMIEINVNRSP